MHLAIVDRLILVLLLALMALFLVRLAIQWRAAAKVMELADLQIAELTQGLDSL